MTRAQTSRVLDELRLLVSTDDRQQSRSRLDAFDPNLVPALVAVARAHGVEAWLAACSPSTEGVWAELAQQRQRFLAARTRRRADTLALQHALDGAGCPWALLKGATIAAHYPRPDLRHSVDIDVLVAPADFARALDALVDGGFDLLDQNWPLIAALMPGELRVRAPGGTIIDLHWDLINDRKIRSELRFSTEELLERADVDSSGWPALDPTDQLIHASTHAALAGANRLLWLVDLDRLIRSEPPNWPLFAARLSRTGAGGLAAIALDRAHAVLGAPLDSQLLGEMMPARIWLTIDRQVIHGYRLTVDPGAPSTARSFARAIRATNRATAAQLGRHGRGWLRSGAPRSRRNKPPNWLDSANESSTLHAVADLGAQRQYLGALGGFDGFGDPARLRSPDLTPIRYG